MPKRVHELEFEREFEIKSFKESLTEHKRLKESLRETFCELGNVLAINCDASQIFIQMGIKAFNDYIGCYEERIS